MTRQLAYAMLALVNVLLVGSDMILGQPGPALCSFVVGVVCAGVAWREQ